MRLQEFIHSLEQGRLAKWVIFFVVLVPDHPRLMRRFVVWHFQGLSEAKGMEQAQISREIARGNGFSTKSVTPLAYAVFKKKGPFPLDKTPDIYYAPLNPLLNSVFPAARTKSSWVMTQNQGLAFTRVIASSPRSPSHCWPWASP